MQSNSGTVPRVAATGRRNGCSLRPVASIPTLTEQDGGFIARRGRRVHFLRRSGAATYCVNGIVPAWDPW